MEWLFLRENKASMNYNLLLGLMEKAILFCGLNYNATDTLFVLKSKNFEEDKKVLINKLEQGEKILIISSYSTIGAGQNLQYAVTDKTNYMNLPNIKIQRINATLQRILMLCILEILQILLPIFIQMKKLQLTS